MMRSTFSLTALAAGLLLSGAAHAGFIAASGSDPNEGPGPALYVPPTYTQSCNGLSLGLAFVTCTFAGSATQLVTPSGNAYASPGAADLARVVTSTFGASSAWAGPSTMYVGNPGENYGAGGGALVDVNFGTRLEGGLTVEDTNQVVVDILQDLDGPFVLMFGGTSYNQATYFFFDPAGGVAAGTRLLFNGNDYFTPYLGLRPVDTTELWLVQPDATTGVPEPQSLALVVLALTGLVLSRRR